ncbi:gamma-glutamyl-gamma-aminobutyrate hydrolase family protein [Ellagibacter isourolithinifaciens]|uniref:gamma-glutamyl-gamma-aminobutyrate hydrolase family protein n=1 Tax=Ellagibacter isourolithinifaciens TaxID=2137581 RepID=UPI003FD7CB57
MSKVEQRPVIGIVPTQVPDEDIVRVYGSDGLVEAIEVRDRTFMMGVRWHPEYFAGERSMGCIFKTLSMEASKARSREERLREEGLHIESQDAGGRWPSIHFADCI